MKVSRKNSGFSLIEIIAVVAIIGLLTTLAMPAYNKYIGRARQAGAKAKLAKVFIVQEAFYAQYNTYFTDWPAMGFAPDGYTAGFITTKTQRYAILPGPASGLPIVTQLGISSTPIWDASYGYGASTGACDGLYTGSDSPRDNIEAATASAVLLSTARTTFLNGTAGCPVKPCNDTTCLDIWTIDQSNNLKQWKSDNF